ncbi:HAD-superfamily subfamily IIA hydrolase [Nemania sp. NC0429]|nr:HAD-superfamily subfamily IIA hydrolase [Nemania sp. NC0429]
MPPLKDTLPRVLGHLIRPRSRACPLSTLSHMKTPRARNRNTALHRTSHGVLIPTRTFIPEGDKAGTTSQAAPRFAFAFDIDGVLLHVAKPIPGATETLKYLQHHKIPFILLTNGGGKHEHERVKDLSNRLGVPLSPGNFVQSHTPFTELVHGSWSQDAPDGHAQGEPRKGLRKPGLADQNILITGSDPEKSRLIAEAYGFRSVITPADILAAHPTIFPFETVRAVDAAAARPLPSPNPRIAAIFVFNDPRDWALDTQIITDLLLSRGGVLGTYSPRNGRAEHADHGWQGDGQPALYFSNHDLLWSAGYHLPRFGQGAFQAALAGVWRQVTGGRAELRRTTIGKPYARTYGYAERVLAEWRAALLKGESGADADVDMGVDLDVEPLNRVYMVGDNPESDIRGANEYASPRGTEWASILVRTGVWSEDRDGEPKYRPTVVMDDVKAAVEWAVKRERSAR